MIKNKFYPLIDNIIAYESGDLSAEDSLVLFSELIKSGTINTLQGSYQRTAQGLLEAGYIDIRGNIIKELEG